MGQAYSKAAKRRNKKAQGGKRAMFEKLEAVQDAVREADKITSRAEDPREVVKHARARVMGRAATDALLSPMLCEEAGRAISIGAKGDAEILWDTFKGLDNAERKYFLRIIGRPRFPNVAKIEYMPEVFETRADDTPDHRDPDEKDRAASNAWMTWQGYLGQLPGFQREALTRASWQMDELHKGDRLTVSGETFVAALRSLADVVERG